MRWRCELRGVLTIEKSLSKSQHDGVYRCADYLVSRFQVISCCRKDSDTHHNAINRCYLVTEVVHLLPMWFWYNIRVWNESQCIFIFVACRKILRYIKHHSVYVYCKSSWKSAMYREKPARLNMSWTLCNQMYFIGLHVLNPQFIANIFQSMKVKNVFYVHKLKHHLRYFF